MRFFHLAALLLALTACPKSTGGTNVAGTDDEQMDQFGAQLEELRTRQGLECKDYCSLKGKVCDISKSACDIAGKHDDFQKRCVQSQEDCAHFNEGCGSCK
jgi:predicted heme/steroid binding protein